MHTCYLHWYNYVDPRFQCFLHTINKQKKIPLLRDTRSDFCLWTQGNLYNTKRNWGTQEISMDLCRCKLFWKTKILQWKKKESKSLELLYIQFSDKLSMQSPFCPSYWPRRMLRHSKCIKTRSHFLKHWYCISSDKIYDAAFAAVRVNFN